MDSIRPQQVDVVVDRIIGGERLNVLSAFQSHI